MKNLRPNRTLRRAVWTAAAVLLAALTAGAGESVFKKPPREYAVEGTIHTSKPKSFSGTLYTTLGKPLKIYDRTRKRSVSFTLKEIARIDVSVEEEHEEPYWYWKESGSDEKVYTGKTYPWHKYVTTVTFTGGKNITGDLAGLVYHETPEGKKTSFTLRKRHKGKEGQKPSDLVYVMAICLDVPAPAKPP